MRLVLTLSHGAGYTGEVRTLICLAQTWDTKCSLALGLSLTHTRAPFFSECVCVCVCVCLLVCMKGRLSPTAVVTQLCLVYIGSDNSGSKHRSPYADVPLMAFKHVCGSACLYV